MKDTGTERRPGERAGTEAVQLYALTPAGPRALAVPAGARHAHELFDGLPLLVYSALRTFQHERFLGLEHHLERTDRSLELLGRPERLDRTRLRAALDRCARAYPGTDAFVRFDVLAEPARALGTEERTLLALSPFVPVPEAYRRTGVGVGIAGLSRTDPLIKKARFVLERRPYPLGSQEAYEHLIVDGRGYILEGTSSNFLALVDGELRLTGDEALQGITQRIVAELARGLGLAVVRRPVRRDELGSVSEAFLTGSTRGILSVVAVEGVPIGAGRPGPWTERLARAYDEHAQQAARPAVEHP